jgi:hypothetical protein
MSDEEPAPDLTPEEYESATVTFVERLRNAMSTSGCNDVFADEFGAPIARKYRSDYDVLEAWERYHDAMFDRSDKEHR